MPTARRAFGKFDSLGQQLDADALTKNLANLSRGSHPDSVRLPSVCLSFRGAPAIDDRLGRERRAEFREVLVDHLVRSRLKDDRAGFVEHDPARIEQDRADARKYDPEAEPGECLGAVLQVEDIV
jgi:hypothetical protein